jgi:hypothetical protein
MTFNLTRDASNNVTGATVNFVVNLTNFPNGTSWRLAHIHEGGSGVAGPVRIDTKLTPNTAITLTNGSVSNQQFTSDLVTDVTLLNSILNNPAGFYFNAHTAVNPTGAVRGQLVRQ